jgi:hypothetical protein
MRLMLGTLVDGKQTPSLLVNVHQEHSPTHFEFWVVNGCWEGTFTNGYITVYHPYEPFTSLDKVEILCDNQDRLRTTGWYSDADKGYQKVFDNFHNPDYVAPKEKKVQLPEDWDDDIAF